MNIRQSMKLSAIVDKMGIRITDAKGSQEEIGADLMIQVVSKAYKAEMEIYNFISEIKKITVDEAQEIDIVEFIKEIGNISGIKDFFPSVIK